MPKVTVLIPVYNRAHYIHDAIDSILAQTLTDFEILVVDDGSTDDSCALVNAYNDPRIRLLRNSRNLGIAATRNHGIAAARGEYLAFLDSDDRALPERLERQTAFLDSHPDYAAVGTWMEWMDESGRRTGKIKRKPVSSDQIRAERLFRSGLENSTAMARTAILQQYDHREDMALGSDYDLWARIAGNYELAALPRVLVYRREHPQRATETKLEVTKHLRFEIFAWQLQALGVTYSQQDLENHYLLRRMHKEGFTPDEEFLDWAEAWLLQLKSANAGAGIYPEPAFSGVLGGFWLKTCWNTVSQSGRRPWRVFWGSLLRPDAWLGVRTEIRQLFDARIAGLRRG